MAYDNAKLVELFEKIQRKNHLEAVLKELRENIAQLEPEVRKLMTQMYIEQEDVDKIEGNGLKSFFYSLTGRKYDIIDKERQEAYDAKKKYDAANFQLETMKNDLKRYIDEYNEVRYLEPDYEKAIKEKIELIKAKGSIETEKIAEFDKQIDVFISKNNELREARAAASEAAAKANEVVSKLSEALKVSKNDVMGLDRNVMRQEGEKYYVEYTKYGKLKEANYMAFELRKAIQEMDRELSDVKEDDISVNIGTMMKLGDTLFDDVFSNVSVMNKIKDYIDKFEGIRDRIGGVVISLNDEISENEGKMNKIKAERDEIVRNAEV